MRKISSDIFHGVAEGVVAGGGTKELLPKEKWRNHKILENNQNKQTLFFLSFFPPSFPFFFCESSFERHDDDDCDHNDVDRARTIL